MKTHLTTLHNGSRACAMTEPVPGRKPVLALPMRLLWAAALALPAFGAQAGVVFTTLHLFQGFLNGTAGLVQSSDGNLYGTTEVGGTDDYGTVFKISTKGALTSLYSFTGRTDGANPYAGLVQGTDGSFYGTTLYGGTNNNGTVFRIGSDGAFTRLYSFTGANDGANPQAGLVQGSDGNFYGTTIWGGANGSGTVFRINTNGVLTSLHSFNAFDGAYPSAGLVEGSDGNLYGTTSGGTTNHLGTVFKISTTGALTTLHLFTGGNDGGEPKAGLVQGSDGNFYGTTPVFYDNFGRGYGTVFKISPKGVLTNLSSFALTGENPEAGLVQGSDGNFYGTTTGRGTKPTGHYGAVFQISTHGALTTLYSFTGGNDGANPLAGLVQGSDGNFYGMTSGGGASSDGTVFQISTNGALTSLHSFTAGDDGVSPSGLVEGTDGNFYGTAYGSGVHGFGTVFKISTKGAVTRLYSFTGGNDGATPAAGLMQGSDGKLYGTTHYGGTHHVGTVFEISTTGMLTSLYSFTAGNDGAFPEAGLVQGRDGDFYGTTSSGGPNNSGTVFKISTSGALTSLYSFTGTNDGAYPQAGLVQGSDGNFYGTTAGGGTNNSGTVFKISTGGTLTSLHSFSGIDGAAPLGGLVQGSDGSFYGTIEGGGTNGVGTVFKISTDGRLTSLYSFHGALYLPVGQPLPGNDGANPRAGLVQGSDGSFYGTTYFGGAYSRGCDNCLDTFTYGTLFNISTNGEERILNSFDDLGGGLAVIMGVNPEAGLVQGSDGSFYGTTSYGGSPVGFHYWGFEGPGAVFRMSPDGAMTPVSSFVGSAGANPRAALVQGSDGNFYGTTANGGLTNYNPQSQSDGYGTVFRISTNGVLTSLYSFTGTNDGADPVAALVQGSDGYFYGTTKLGGTYTNGTVFKISTYGALTSLYSFTGGNDGAQPQAGLVQGRDGYLYGTTVGGGSSGNGTVFAVNTNGTGFTTLYSFSAGSTNSSGVYTNSDGANPQAGLILVGNNLYGTTSAGGSWGDGTVFSLTLPGPQLTIIPSGPYVILAWPTDYAGFSYAGYTLQSTTNLVSPVWSPVSPEPVVIGGENVVINIISGRQQFYRLSQ